jgi:hypothetical protein
METLDKYFRQLAKAAFAQHGFASEQLISQWEAIVGETISTFCRPERIIWPKTAAESNRKAGGTLVLKAQSGRGLELQYETPRIIERVNQFLGYGAITAIKIVQSGFAAKPKRQPVTPVSTHAWDEKISDISDEQLKAALARLAAHAAPNGPKLPLSTGENRDWPLNATSFRKTP